MKIITKDILISAAIATITSISSILLYLDFTKKVEHGNTRQIGTITFKKKIAERKYAGQVIWENIEQNAPLYNFDSIRTDKGSLSILHLENGAEIELDENTLILLNLTDKGATIDFSYGAIAAKKTASGLTKLNIVSGRSTIEIAKGGVNLSQEEDQSLKLNVTSGDAKIKTEKGTQEVLSNQTASISKLDTKIKENTLFPKSPVHNKYFLTSTPKSKINFTWKSEKKQKIYLEVSPGRSFSEILYSSAVKKSYHKFLLRPGTYYWRIRTTGKQKEISQIRKFTLLKDKGGYLISPPDNSKYTYVNILPVISFKWTDSEFVSTYMVEIADDPKIKNIIKTFKCSVSSIATDKLSEGTYYWRVKNIYSFGGIESSIPDMVRKLTVVKNKEITPPALGYPSDNETISSILLSGRKFLFNWRSNNDITEFDFSISKNKSFKEKVFTAKTRNKYYQLSKLLEPGKYYWRVAGISKDRGTFSHSEPRKFIIIAAEKLTTVKPFAGDILNTLESNKKINFTWKDPNVGNLYLFEVSSDKKFSKIIYSNYTSLTSHAAEIIKPGTFYWRVSLVNSDKKILASSNISSMSIAKKLTDPKAIYPAHQNIIDMTNKNDITFSWESVKDATLYKFALYQFIGGARKHLIDIKSKNTKINFKKLELLDIGNFYWELQAFSYSGDKITGRSRTKKYFFSIKLETTAGSPEIISSEDIYIE